MIYIREAHPSEGWQMESNVREGLEFVQPVTPDGRQEVAETCVLSLRLSMPTLLDDMDNTADQLFNGWPERLYVLSPAGAVLYQGGKGPFGFHLEELEQFLETRLP